MVGFPRLNPSPAAGHGSLTQWLRKERRFFRSPKGYLLVALVALAAIAAPPTPAAGAAMVLAWAIAGSVAMELVLVRMETGVWSFPSSALLTGLIVGMVVGPFEPWYVAAIAGLLAIAAKHLLRLGRGHVFNPAAFGLVAVFLLFGTGQSWWGALPDLPAVAVAALLAAGYLVAERANKLPAALSFLGVYVALFTVTAFAGNPAGVSAMFRTPFVNAALFFAAFMVTDPPTSPVPFREQAWFGALVAVASYAIYMLTQSVAFLPAALLAGNVASALWRVAFRPRSLARRSAGARPVQAGSAAKVRAR